MGSATSRLSQPCDQLSFRELSLTGSSVAEGVNEGEQFVEVAILACGLWNGPMQRFQRQSANGPFRVRPYRREISILRDQISKRGSGIRRGNAASGLTANRGKDVLHAMD